MNNVCELKKICGGCDYDCSLKEETYDEQIKNKSLYVSNMLKNKINDLSQNEEIISSPLQNEYRNKMEFTFGDSEKDGPLKLGMHQKNAFYNILDAKNCEMMDHNVRKIVELTEKFFRDKKIKHYHKKNHTGFLRNLIVRKSFYQNEYLINLITTSEINDLNIQIEKLLDEYKNYLLDELENVKINIIRTINNSVADAVKCENLEIIYGNDYIYEKINNLIFKISPFSFFQTNTMCAEILYNKIIEYVKLYIKKDAVIYDLFCGTGTIGQLVSPLAKKVYGVEIIKEAVESAKENAKINNIKNIEFIAEDINLLLKNNKFNFEKPDIIILDPPRGGIIAKTLEKVIEFDAKIIIYVSCKIESFVRDCDVLLNRGYKIRKFCPIDMFPQTKNVETVILLKKE